MFISHPVFSSNAPKNRTKSDFTGTLAGTFNLQEEKQIDKKFACELRSDLFGELDVGMKAWGCACATAGPGPIIH